MFCGAQHPQAAGESTSAMGSERGSGVPHKSKVRQGVITLADFFECVCGVLDRNRTCGLCLRRAALYPTELRGHAKRNLNAKGDGLQGLAVRGCWHFPASVVWAFLNHATFPLLLFLYGKGKVATAFIDINEAFQIFLGGNKGVEGL